MYISRYHRVALTLANSFIFMTPYGWNHPGSTSLSAKCHEIIFKAELLLGPFFTKSPESFCILSRKGSIRRIVKNILKRVSQKVGNICFLLAMILDVQNYFFFIFKIMEGHKKWNISSTNGWIFTKFDTQAHTMSMNYQ